MKIRPLIATTTVLASFAFTLALGSLSADAAVTFTFQRISDTQATMAATGQVDLGFPTGLNEGTWEHLELRGVMDAVGLVFGSVEQVAGDFQWGGTALQGWSVLDSDMLASPNLFFGDLDSPSGTSSQEVIGGGLVWRPVGTTGEVWAEYVAFDSDNNGFNGYRQIGTWEIVAERQIVPEPGSLVAVGCFLAAGLTIRKRRQIA